VIAVLIPAHNEEQLIGACLRSVALAARCAGLRGEAVQVFVALDRCSDGTAGIVAAHLGLTDFSKELERTAACGTGNKGVEGTMLPVCSMKREGRVSARDGVSRRLHFDPRTMRLQPLHVRCLDRGRA
jgi:glycosyltransferase involved in cell wall biosynthesis